MMIVCVMIFIHTHVIPHQSPILLIYLMESLIES